MATRADQVGRICAILLCLLLVGFALSRVPGDAGTPTLPAVALLSPAETVHDVLASGTTMVATVPQATLDFIRAYARGDEVTNELVASPLYRFEWERRGLSAERRARIASPGWRTGDAFQERLSFAFMGGAVDGLGFGHLLFAARPAQPNRSAVPSVFRIDVDPTGKVIWTEMVWHFGASVEAVRPVRDLGELARVPSPTLECCARLLFGVTSLDGGEGYYAYEIGGASASWANLSEALRPARVKFFALDSDRQVRAGAWAYDQDEVLAEYGKPKTEPPAPQLEADDAILRQDYLTTLD